MGRGKWTTELKKFERIICRRNVFPAATWKGDGLYAGPVRFDFGLDMTMIPQEMGGPKQRDSGQPLYITEANSFVPNVIAKPPCLGVLLGRCPDFQVGRNPSHARAIPFV
ncbi:hypothetical protein NL676_030903 [Syzygium grande]|nr:hypothetical protein NL676_030903 [Syzygium grande]